MDTIPLPRAPTPSTATVAGAIAAWGPVSVLVWVVVWVVVAAAHPTRFGVAIAASLTVAVVAAAIDRRTGLLPDGLVGVTALPAVVAGVAAGVAPDVLVGALVFATPVLAVHVVAPAAMGFGDVKFAAALGAPIGLIDPAWSLVALCVASGVGAAIGIARRSATVPFGPGLVIGAVVALTASAIVPTGLSAGRVPWR